MYKAQIKAQKIVCLVALVMAALLFLYALGIMTDLYDALYTTLSIRRTENEQTHEPMLTAKEKSVPGAMVYFDMQQFDQRFVIISIVYIIIACLLFITNTSTRRRYYVSNYVAVGLFTAASIAIPIYANPWISYYKAMFQRVDFAALKEYSEIFNSKYTESTFWFDAQYIVFGLMILAAVLLVACTVWKIMLMKDEKALVAEGRKA